MKFRLIATAVLAAALTLVTGCGGITIPSQEDTFRETLKAKQYDKVEVQVITDKVKQRNGKTKTVVTEYDATANVKGFKNCELVFEQKPGAHTRYHLDEVNGRDVPQTDRQKLGEPPLPTNVVKYLAENMQRYGCLPAV